MRVAEAMEVQRRSKPWSIAALALAAMTVGEVLAVSQSQQSTVNSVNSHSLLSSRRSQRSRSCHQDRRAAEHAKTDQVHAA